MRTYTIEQYREMAARFNKMDFKKKIETIMANKDLLVLACDIGWWGVMVLDTDMHEALEAEDISFDIKNEWDHNEMEVLLNLLGLRVTGF